MRTITLLVLMFILTSCSAASKEDFSNVYNPKTDAQYGFITQDPNPNSDCVATGAVPQDCSAFIYRASREFLSYYENQLYIIREAVDLKSKL